MKTFFTKRLYKVLILCFVMLAFYLIWECRQVPEGMPAERPITDVAPAPPKVEQTRRELVTLKKGSFANIPKDAGKIQSQLPPAELMDLRSPPRWTQLIAHPQLNPSPPDVHATPAIQVDSRRQTQ